MYKNTQELLDDDPEAAMSKKHHEYLERPSWGWMKVSDTRFIGIGYHGNESGEIKDGWEAAKADLGHIPEGGYG